MFATPTQWYSPYSYYSYRHPQMWYTPSYVTNEHIGYSYPSFYAGHHYGSQMFSAPKPMKLPYYEGATAKSYKKGNQYTYPTHHGYLLGQDSNSFPDYYNTLY